MIILEIFTLSLKLSIRVRYGNTNNGNRFCPHPFLYETIDH